MPGPALQSDDGTYDEPDSIVNIHDPWFWFCYDEHWRIVATFRADDEHPKEVFLHHNAGLDGDGGSSYIDSIIMRDRDANTVWFEEADSSREERTYYLQNWRHDVSVLLTSGGSMIQWIKYSAYGVPFGIPAGDVNADGQVTQADANLAGTWPTTHCDRCHEPTWTVVRFDGNQGTPTTQSRGRWHRERGTNGGRCHPAGP